MHNQQPKEGSIWRTFSGISKKSETFQAGAPWIQKPYPRPGKPYPPPKSFLCGLLTLFFCKENCTGAGRCMLSFSQCVLGNRKAFQPEFGAYLGFGAGFDQNRPRFSSKTAERRRRVLEKGTFIFCAKLWYAPNQKWSAIRNLEAYCNTKSDFFSRGFREGHFLSHELCGKVPAWTCHFSP